MVSGRVYLRDPKIIVSTAGYDFIVLNGRQVQVSKTTVAPTDELPDAPTGFVYLIGTDGIYLTNGDGEYLLVAGS